MDKFCRTLNKLCIFWIEYNNFIFTHIYRKFLPVISWVANLFLCYSRNKKKKNFCWEYNIDILYSNKESEGSKLPFLPSDRNCYYICLEICFVKFSYWGKIIMALRRFGCLKYERPVRPFLSWPTCSQRVCLEFPISRPCWTTFSRIFLLK